MTRINSQFIGLQLLVAKFSTPVGGHFYSRMVSLTYQIHHGGADMNLGENIYNLRTEKNLSQGSLADALDVSRQSVSKWENNSAVPELDKLVKMAEIFGVTIDQLVTGKAPGSATPAQPEPKVVYIEKPVKQGLTATQILGIIFAFCALLFLVLFACFGDAHDLAATFILCLPVAEIGVLCLVTKHPLLWCSWVCSASLWFFTLLQVGNGDIRVLDFGFLPAKLLWLTLSSPPTIATTLYTIHLHKKGSIHVPVWGWGLLAVAFIVLLLVVITFEPKPYLIW
jgi:transcriptional regulator with XRE-family HTH domain